MHFSENETPWLLRIYKGIIVPAVCIDISLQIPTILILLVPLYSRHLLKKNKSFVTRQDLECLRTM